MKSYTELVKSDDEALCHLFLHCCLKDGVFTPEEIDLVAGKFVALGLQSVLNFKEEVIRYRSYKDYITDEDAYLKYLLGLLPPVNELALYSYCVELVISDATLDAREEMLLDKIAKQLNINETEYLVVKKLMLQRKIFESQSYSDQSKL